MSPAVIARKIAEIGKRVDRVRALLPTSARVFRRQQTEAEALILNLYLALQGAADLAMHVVATRGLGVPGEARDAYQLLGDAGIIDAPLAERLAASVGLRNRIAHEYGKLDLDLVYQAALDDLHDLEILNAAVATAFDL